MLYARLMTACGYTPAEIDDMAMADVLELLRYWRQAPPTNEILAAVYGIRGPKAAQPSNTGHDPSGIGSLIARHPNGRVCQNQEP